jgi:hypothetical protein
MPKPCSDIGASVRTRPANLTNHQNQPLQLPLKRFLLKGLHHRLNLTTRRDSFGLMGSLLVSTWLSNPHCPVRNVDFFGFGNPNSENVLGTFREICAVTLRDTVELGVAALSADQIRTATSAQRKASIPIEIADALPTAFVADPGTATAPRQCYPLPFERQRSRCFRARHEGFNYVVPFTIQMPHPDCSGG